MVVRFLLFLLFGIGENVVSCMLLNYPVYASCELCIALV